jgi:hypothetical protein
VTEQYLDQLLREWANIIIKEAEISLQPAWAKKVQIRSTLIVVPSYWPNRKIWRINEGILSLEIPQRNILVAKYILGHGERRIAKELKKNRYQTRKLFKQARNNLILACTNQPI